MTNFVNNIRTLLLYMVLLIQWMID